MTLIWEAITKIHDELRKIEVLPDFILIELLNTSTKISFEKKRRDADIVIHLNQRSKELISPLKDYFFDIEICQGIKCCDDNLELLNFYLPFAFSSFFGRKYNKCFTISHFAQTLDGKIATYTGDSKWIGNEENLLHSHRMRALCDGILVGAKTVYRDNPRLNVRKVSGCNPIKIIIDGTSQLKHEQYHAIEPSTILFTSLDDGSDLYDCIEMPKKLPYDPYEILKILTKKGIYSIYIEGGSYTTSYFLEQNMLDQVQIHFSSKILGSGLSSFEFGKIKEIKNSVKFQSTRFKPMGDEMMFIGNL